MLANCLQHIFKSNKALAEDLVQEVFIGVWKRKASLEVSHSLKPYLFKALNNGFINAYRKQKQRQQLHLQFAQQLDRIQQEFTESNIQHYLAIIEQEIRALPPQCQKVFILHKKEGLTHSEIADYLQISVKAVEAHMRHAYSQVRQQLHNKGYGYKNILLFLWMKMQFASKPTKKKALEVLPKPR